MQLQFIVIVDQNTRRQKHGENTRIRERPHIT